MTPNAPTPAPTTEEADDSLEARSAILSHDAALAELVDREARLAGKLRRQGATSAAIDYPEFQTAGLTNAAALVSGTSQQDTEDAAALARWRARQRRQRRGRDPAAAAARLDTLAKPRRPPRTKVVTDGIPPTPLEELIRREAHKIGPGMYDPIRPPSRTVKFLKAPRPNCIDDAVRLQLKSVPASAGALVYVK